MSQVPRARPRGAETLAIICRSSSHRTLIPPAVDHVVREFSRAGLAQAAKTSPGTGAEQSLGIPLTIVPGFASSLTARARRVARTENSRQVSHGELDLHALLAERYFVAAPEELRREQASELITWVQTHKGLAPKGVAPA